MDPTQTWYDLIAAVREGRTEDAKDLHEALDGWLARGGFYPGGWPTAGVNAFLAYLKQKWELFG